MNLTVKLVCDGVEQDAGGEENIQLSNPQLKMDITSTATFGWFEAGKEYSVSFTSSEKRID